MRLKKTKYKLWQIMLAIAALAGLFARFGVTRTAGTGVALSVAVLPVVLARPGRKLRASAWVCSLYPLLILGSVYATWLTAWFILGHQPRISLDNPKDISPIVDVEFISTTVFILGSPIALILGVPLVVAHDIQTFRSEGLHELRTTVRLTIPLVVWSSVFIILWLRLLGVDAIAEWYAD
jgi:hypothetical protein